MGNLQHDIRVALRALSRRPGFTFAAVLTLTLGIGATCAVYSVVNGVLLQPLPYETPDRLVLIEGTHSDGGLVEDWPISYPDFESWGESAGAFEQIAACSNPRSFNLLGENEAERVTGELVSSRYFEIFGVSPQLGRTFSDEEAEPAASAAVAVLSDIFWRRRFGADPNILGQVVNLSGRSFAVIGVMAPGFRGWSDQADLWVPAGLVDELGGPGSNYLFNRRARWLTVVGRLAPGVSVTQAQRELDRINASLESTYAGTNEGHGARVQTLREAYAGDLKPALLTLLGSVGCVLLIACVNVANLLMVHGARRQQEYAVRSVLGARRSRLIGQLLTESVLLAVLGAVLGLAVAQSCASYLVSLADIELRSFVHIGLDPTVVGVVVVLTFVVGVGSGIMPAWLVSRASYDKVLREGGRGSTSGHHRFQNSLVVAEVGLALVLLVGAGLMIRSFNELSDKDLGFRPAGVLSVRFDVKGEHYADSAYRNAIFRDLLDSLRATPGVGAAALVGPGIPTDDWNGLYFIVDGRSDLGKDEPVPLPYHAVTPGYFSLFGVPVVKGRDFTFDDTADSRQVVVVSQAFADRYWPGRDPIGQRLKLGLRDSEAPWITVVGVVGNIHNEGLAGDKRPGPDIYLPMLQNPKMTAPTYAVMIRPDEVEPTSLVSSVRDEMRRLVSDLPPYDIQTMDARLEQQTTHQRFLAVVMSIFAAVALCLAAVGIYGVIAYNVTQRRREIGVRLAVGARRGTIFGLIMKQSMTLVAAGIGLGLLASFALRKILGSVLFGLAETDSGTLALSTVFLLLVGLLATYLPARSAMKVDPAVAILQEGERS